MKRVAIITITRGQNYGNRLQNYAVQTVLEKLGFEPYTIHNNDGSNFNFKEILKSILKRTIFYFKYKDLFKRIKKFNDFNSRYIKFDKIKINNDIMQKSKIKNSLLSKYDFWIAGSDQIWNLNYPENNIVNFLGFVPEKNKKISFSASFGTTNIPEKIDCNIKEWLNDINYISVREYAGCNIVKKLTGREDSEVLIDPTLMLESSYWKDLSKKPKEKIPKKYILNYFLGDLSESRKKIIEKFAIDNHCEIINLLDINSKFYNCDPCEFLYLEENAFLICTDSFHSCVFSFLFDRPFVIFEREDGVVSMNSRIETLIDTFQLKDRKFCNSITNSNLNHNYEKSYIILKKEREKGIQFLNKSLRINIDKEMN